MKKGKNAAARADEAATHALQELFADSSDPQHFDFDGVEFSPFGRIATAVTAMGGVVSLYGSRDGNGVVISIRVGERSKRYEFENADEWNTLIEQIANPWHVALGRYLAAKRADELLSDPSPGRSQGS